LRPEGDGGLEILQDLPGGFTAHFVGVAVFQKAVYIPRVEA